jgi:hypothetical protein
MRTRFENLSRFGEARYGAQPRRVEWGGNDGTSLDPVLRKLGAVAMDERISTG